MITILHGDDLNASRTYYLQIKQRADTSVTLDGSSLDVTTLLQSLTGDGLFEEEKTVFVEQLLTKRKKSKELDGIIEAINKNSQKDIILWEGKELDRKVSSLFPKATLQPFKLPQVLFTFLDGLRPGSGKSSVKLFHQVLQSAEPEVVLAMIVRQFRLLLAVNSKAENPIEEIKRMAPWQQQKLSRQKKLFSEEKLISLYHDLFQLDLGSKTGQLALPLSSAIDIFLMKL